MTKEEFLAKYAEHLNEQQRTAIQTVQGPVLLLAVPGSGKTTVLVNRIGYMLYVAGIAPENILTLTYTVAATRDMSRRFASIFGEDFEGALEFRTINGICAKVIQSYARVIGRQAFRLLPDEKSTGKVVTDIQVRHLPEYPTESDVKAVRTLITYCKNMLLTQEEIRELGEKERIPLAEIYKEYNRYLRDHSVMDYDDQMLYAYRLLKNVPDLLRLYQNKYRYICVDEAQDTSKIQHLIIGLLAGTNGNLFLVGDEDQSIYGFRAAYPEALLGFEKDHSQAKVLVMDRNYRSTAAIVAAADAFIQHNRDRHEKHMSAVREEGAPVHYIELKYRSAQYRYLTKVADGCSRETAVLYRDNESALPLADQLDRMGIPFRIRNADMGFFTQRVVMDVTSIIRFALDPYDAELFMRIYYKCQTFLRKNQAEQLCKVSAKRNIPILEAVNYVKGINGMVAGKCRAMSAQLGCISVEDPSKILFRIEKPMGYGDYLERNHIDSNKLFILKMIARQEGSAESFLARLEYLREMVKTRQQDKDCPFILSTIHSSKGLEYDQVYLMDVCDGVFPGKLDASTRTTKEQEEKNLEEERRLFYVGMTRAKNGLHIFKFEDAYSRLVRELQNPVRSRKETGRTSGSRKSAKVIAFNRTDGKAGSRTASGKREMPDPNWFAGRLPEDFELIIGERVVQRKFGAGVVSDVEYDKNGKVIQFEVTFDSGEERVFLFPLAFRSEMWLESSEAKK